MVKSPINNNGFIFNMLNPQIWSIFMVKSPINNNGFIFNMLNPQIWSIFMVKSPINNNGFIFNMLNPQIWSIFMVKSPINNNGFIFNMLNPQIWSIFMVKSPTFKSPCFIRFNIQSYLPLFHGEVSPGAAPAGRWPRGRPGLWLAGWCSPLTTRVPPLAAWQPGNPPIFLAFDRKVAMENGWK